MPPSRKFESSSFTVGRIFARSCLRLVVMSIIVVMSVIKVVMGAEYVHACPLEPTLPVYVVVSGCLPVLLSALRDPYDKSEHDKGDKKSSSSSYTFMMGVAVLGIVLNTAWLVAGSAWVYSAWYNIKIQETFCQQSIINITEQDQGHINISAVSENSAATLYSLNASQASVSDVTNANFPVGNIDKTLNVSAGAETTVGSNTQTFTRNITSDNSSTGDVEKIRGNNTNNPCKSCDVTLLRFASFCVVMDWACAAVGLVYLCYRCFKVVLWVKGEFRKIVYKGV